MRNREGLACRVRRGRGRSIPSEHEEAEVIQEQIILNFILQAKERS